MNRNMTDEEKRTAMEKGEDKTDASTTLRNFALLDTFLSDPNRKVSSENNDKCETSTESMPPNVPIQYICPTNTLGMTAKSSQPAQFVILKTMQPVTSSVVYQSHAEADEQSVTAPNVSTWKYEDEVQLVKLRMQFNHLFLGDRSTVRESWERISMNLGYGASQCRKKWDSMLKKYKTLKIASESAPEGSETIITWRPYETIDKYLGNIIHNLSIEDDFNEGENMNYCLSDLIRRKQQSNAVSIPKAARINNRNQVKTKQTQKRLLESPQHDVEDTHLKVCVQQKSKRMMELQSRKKRDPSPNAVSPEDHCEEIMTLLRETTERERRDRNRILNIIENILSATTVENTNEDS